METDLIEKAKELCELKVEYTKEVLKDLEIAGATYIMGFSKDWWLAELHSWQTHLDEFGEHKTVSFVTINVKVPEVGKVFDYERTCACGSVTIESECPIAELKAKRLLGEE